jgi:hypothetical protein
VFVGDYLVSVEATPIPDNQHAGIGEDNQEDDEDDAEGEDDEEEEDCEDESDGLEDEEDEDDDVEEAKFTLVIRKHASMDNVQTIEMPAFPSNVSVFKLVPLSHKHVGVLFVASHERDNAENEYPDTHTVYSSLELVVVNVETREELFRDQLGCNGGAYTEYCPRIETDGSAFFVGLLSGASAMSSPEMRG